MSAQWLPDRLHHQLLLLSMDTSSNAARPCPRSLETSTVTLRTRSLLGTETKKVCWGTEGQSPDIGLSQWELTQYSQLSPWDPALLHHRQCPDPPCPGRAALLLTCRARPRHRKVTEKSMWRRATAPSQSSLEVSMGSGTGKETQIPSIQDTDCSHNFGPKSLLGFISAGLPKVLPATNLFLIFCNHLCSCISWRAA